MQAKAITTAGSARRRNFGSRLVSLPIVVSLIGTTPAGCAP